MMLNNNGHDYEYILGTYIELWNENWVNNEWKKLLEKIET